MLYAAIKDFKLFFQIIKQLKMEVNFQTRVNEWMLRCFGAEISKDKTERSHRFLEEAIELVQSNGRTESEARTS